MLETTRIDRAFRSAQKGLFTRLAGARENVSKILLLITDGTQTKDWNAEDPGVIADEIRAAGVQ